MPAIHLVDVLVYLVVLGLFVQFARDVLSESFGVSLLTAILLKLVMELVVAAKTRVVRRIRSAETSRVKVMASVTLVLVAAGSKFVILWLTDVIFGDAVYLGGFLSVTLLVLTLMAARAIVRRVVR